MESFWLSDSRYAVVEPKGKNLTGVLRSRKGPRSKEPER